MNLAINPLIAIGVLAFTSVTDAAYVFFNAAVTSRRRVWAANWSAIWYILSAFAVISYTNNALYVAFAAAGSWLGAFASVTWLHRKQRLVQRPSRPAMTIARSSLCHGPALPLNSSARRKDNYRGESTPAAAWPTCCGVTPGLAHFRSGSRQAPHKNRPGRDGRCFRPSEIAPHKNGARYSTICIGTG